MDKTLRRKAAEAASLSRMGTAILKGNKLGVKWLPDDTDELGFTSGKERVVNVAWYNRHFMDKLGDTEQSVLRMGVFAHELLHQCLTNFTYAQEIIKKLTRAEAAIAMNFFNTLEDPAIEYFAPNIFGGKLLDALRYSIKHIYMMSPGIDKSRDAFTQLMNALICFGDMGIVKGNFTFPEAETYFRKVAPLYNKGITCPDSAKRIDIALECMEITRPLWAEIVKEHEAFEEFLKILQEIMEASGMHIMEDEEGSMTEPAGSGASSRRKELLSKITEDDGGEGEGEGSSDTPDTPDSENGEAGEGKTLKVEASDGGCVSNSGSSSSSADAECFDQNQGGDADNEGDSDDTDEGRDDDGQSGNTGDSSSGDNTSGSKNDPHPEMDDGSNITLPEETANEIANEVYEIDDDRMSEIEQSILSEEAKLEKESRREGGEEHSEKPLPSFDISSSAFKSASCRNTRVKSKSEHMSEIYKDMCNAYSPEIKTLTKALERIFKSDMAENARATSGSYNIMRGSVGTTARMFDKRRDKANLRDAAIVLAVDLSGSMSGSKVAQARKTAIVFAETLTKLGISYYIVGYTADQYADAEHLHFVDWNNAKKDRETLCTMDALWNNFDGYSIRYAANLLRERPEHNKVLIVITDGEPVCDKYGSYSIGIKDTINAIKDARKFCTTFGIAVGRGCSPNVLQSMYGKDFIYCEDEKLLTNLVGKKLGKLLKAS